MTNIVVGYIIMTGLQSSFAKVNGLFITQTREVHIAVFSLHCVFLDDVPQAVSNLKNCFTGMACSMIPDLHFLMNYQLSCPEIICQHIKTRFTIYELRVHIAVIALH